MTRRKSLSLLAHEDALLRTLYRQFNITVDKLPQRPDDLQKFVATWNRLSGRTDSASELLRYMMNRRKNKKWETLGRDTVKASTLGIEFSDEDYAHLDKIHEQLQVASDNYAVNPESAKRLQEEFARRAGRVVPQEILAAVMMNRRKAGKLATLKPKGDDIGFSDINQVGNG